MTAVPIPDRPPLGRLCNELGPALYAWVGLRLPARLRGRVAVEDVVQEIWLRVIRIYEESFQPGNGTPRAFVFAVAKLVLLEVERHAYASAQKESAPGGTTWQQAIGQLPNEVTSLTQRLSRDERLQRFVAQVNLLDEDDRRLLLFCGMEDMSQREAAERLGLSTDAAAKRWQRLAERLRSWESARDLLAR
jgi:RNA polymerase sigma factor (sigma-70 family)